jgi:hypothetical protein
MTTNLMSSLKNRPNEFRILLGYFSHHKESSFGLMLVKEVENWPGRLCCPRERGPSSLHKF